MLTQRDSTSGFIRAATDRVDSGMKRLILLVLLSGCYVETNRERAKQMVEDLTAARSNFSRYRLSPAPGDKQSDAIENEIDRALEKARVIAGDDK